MGLVSAPVALLAGIAAFASPCFLPLVPALVSYLLGEAAVDVPPSLARVGALPAKGFLTADSLANSARMRRPGARETVPVRAGGPRWWAVANAGAFVVAFSLVFVALWGVALLVGGSVAVLREPARIIAGALLVLMGLHAIGLLSIPALDASFGPRAQWSGRATLGRSAALGILFGVGWSPCIGPVLGAIIALALAAPTAWAGLGLMLVFCAGLGLPILAFALGIDGLSRRMTWITHHRRGIRVAAGILMLAVGLLMATGLLAPLSGIRWSPW